jgi:2-hydroxychromene-2-carboxylate isomerase
MFAALWAKPQDIVTADGRETFLKKHGIDAPFFWQRADSSQLRAELDRRNEAAAQRGVFGVPTFFVDNEMFFGNDRLDFVREQLAAHSADIPA